MLRVVPPEQLRWSKESKTAKTMSNKENETTTRSSEQASRAATHPPRSNGGLQQFPGHTSDLSTMNNLRGSRPSEGHKSRPVKALHGVQSDGAETTDTLNAKHKRRVSLKDLCAADKQRVRQLVEELARVTAEKEKVEGRLAKERHRFERVLQQMQQELQGAAQERARLEQSLHETQLQLQMASSQPYHDDHTHTTSVTRPPNWDNDMQNGCPPDVPPSSEDESAYVRGFKSAQPSQLGPAPRFELYPSNQSSSADPSSLGTKQEVGTMTKGLSPAPLATLSHLQPTQKCDVGTGTGSTPVVPCVRKTSPLVDRSVVPRVSVSTQTASTVGTQTLSPRGGETDSADKATCPVARPYPPFTQPPSSKVPTVSALTHPPLGQEGSRHLRAGQTGALPPQHVLSGPGSQPSILHRAVNQPPSLPPGESQQWGEMMATALQSAQSSLGANGFREQHVEVASGSPPPPPPLDTAWEADVIEALNNTSLHTVASWAGPHGVSTPIAKRREESYTHKSLLSTTAPQDKDLLEELFFLR